jgi:hypothetical protein
VVVLRPSTGLHPWEELLPRLVVERDRVAVADDLLVVPLVLAATAGYLSEVGELVEETVTGNEMSLAVGAVQANVLREVVDTAVRVYSLSTEIASVDVDLLAQLLE